MRHILLFTFLLYLSATQVAYGVVFSPCDLVREIEEEKVTNPDYLDFDYERHISLVVCIAGFRRYDTSYKLTHQNGTGYYGIFGIHDSDMNKCFKRGDPRGPYADIGGMTNHILYGDLRCLAHVVLASQATVDFYTKLCSPPFVKNVSCHLNNYAMVTVFDPIQKDILERTFGTNDDPFLLLTQPPNMTSSATTIAQAQPTQTSNKPLDSSSHPISRNVLPKSTVAATRKTTTVSPKAARLETPVETLHYPQHSGSNPHHAAQTFTVVTCICVLLAILGFIAVKFIKFARRYRMTHGTMGRKLHCGGESASVME